MADGQLLSPDWRVNNYYWKENPVRRNDRELCAKDGPEYTTHYLLDMDGDGDLDFLSASYRDDKIAWYENDGSQNFAARTITTAADGARSVFAADVDGDGDMLRKHHEKVRVRKHLREANSGVD